MSHVAVLTEFFIFNFVVVTTGTGFGISQSSRLSSSVSAMRVLNTGSDVEEAVADALVRISHLSCVEYRLLKCLVLMYYSMQKNLSFIILLASRWGKKRETELLELQSIGIFIPYRSLNFFRGRQEIVLDCSVGVAQVATRAGSTSQQFPTTARQISG